MSTDELITLAAIEQEAEALATEMARVAPDIYGVIVESLDSTRLWLQGIDGPQGAIEKLILIHRVLDTHKPS